MADEFTDVSTKSFGGNLKDSLGGVVVGVLMFLVSFPVLWWSGGVDDVSEVAKKSKMVSDASSVNAGYEGKFVSVTGELGTADNIGDSEFLKPGKWVSLERRPEMYAWVEHEKSKTEKKVGGSSETTTTYTYEKEWTASPRTGFKHPEGHQNPTMVHKAKKTAAGKGTVGAYNFRPSEAELPSGTQLSLSSSMISGQGKLAGDYLMVGNGSLETPSVGDVRISFYVLEPGGRVTLFGEQHGATIDPYNYKDDNNLYRVFNGDRTKAISEMHSEAQVMTWILRVCGFFMMWFGLGMFFGPVNTLLDVLPFLGSVGRFVIFLVAFPVAVVLSLLMVVLTTIAHSPVLLVLTLAALGGGAYYLVKVRKKPQAAPAK